MSPFSSAHLSQLLPENERAQGARIVASREAWEAEGRDLSQWGYESAPNRRFTALDGSPGYQALRVETDDLRFWRRYETPYANQALRRAQDRWDAAYNAYNHDQRLPFEQLYGPRPNLIRSHSYWDYAPVIGPLLELQYHVENGQLTPMGAIFLTGLAALDIADIPALFVRGAVTAFGRTAIRAGVDSSVTVARNTILDSGTALARNPNRVHNSADVAITVAHRGPNGELAVGQGTLRRGQNGQWALELAPSQHIDDLVVNQVVGGARSGQTSLTGLPNARKLTEARLQLRNNTCGVHTSVSIINDIAPQRVRIDFSDIRSQIRANNSAGLDSADLERFIQRNVPDDVAVLIERAVTEDRLLEMLSLGHVISHVDGNHWVRALNTFEEGGALWVRVYDPARGNYEQLLTSFMTRTGPNNQMIWVRH